MRHLLLVEAKPPPAMTAPVLVTPPAIQGTPVVGVVLNFGNGLATGTPNPGVGNFRWQSSANGTTGWATVATAHTYQLTGANLTNFIRFVLDWTNTAGSVTGTSPVIGPVTSPLAPPAPPTVPPTPTTL